VYFSWIYAVLAAAAVLAATLFSLRRRARAELVSQDEGASRARRAFGLFTLLNITAVWGWFSAICDGTIPMRIPVFDYGAPLAFVSLVLLVPAALIARPFIVASSELAELRATRLYLRWSTLFVVVSLVPGLLIILFYLLLVFAPSHETVASPDLMAP
jgi:hypothetical protein